MNGRRRLQRGRYTKSLCLKSEAADAIKAFKVAAENVAQKELREVMTEPQVRAILRDMHEICEQGGIKLNKTVIYQLASNSITEGTIGVLTHTARAMFCNAGLPKFFWLRCSTQLGMV